MGLTCNIRLYEEKDRIELLSALARETRRRQGSLLLITSSVHPRQNAAVLDQVVCNLLTRVGKLVKAGGADIYSTITTIWTGMSDNLTRLTKSTSI